MILAGNLCVCVYVCAHVHVCVCVHVCAHACVSVCTHVHVCVHVYARVCVLVCTCVCSVTRSCPTLWDPWTVGCQASLSTAFSRQILACKFLLECIAIFYSRGPARPKDKNWVLGLLHRQMDSLPMHHLGNPMISVLFAKWWFYMSLTEQRVPLPPLISLFNYIFISVWKHEYAPSSVHWKGLGAMAPDTNKLACCPKLLPHFDSRSGPKC